jgi:hypothetical protein
MLSKIVFSWAYFRSDGGRKRKRKRKLFYELTMKRDQESKQMQLPREKKSQCGGKLRRTSSVTVMISNGWNRR